MVPFHFPQGCVPRTAIAALPSFPPTLITSFLEDIVRHPCAYPQEGAEQAELLGTGGRDAQDCSVCPGRGGVGAHSAEAAPGGAAEAQEAGLRFLTGATPLRFLLPLL